MHMDELLTIPEVATLLKVHEITVRRMLKTKILTAYRVGRMYRLRRDDVDAYLRGTKEHTTTAPAANTSSSSSSVPPLSLAEILSEFIPNPQHDSSSPLRDLSSNKAYLKGLGRK